MKLWICFFLIGLAPIINAQKPNILWIITDDQRADALSCYNQAIAGTNDSPLGYVESPSIDAIATEGVLFTNAYCNSPACAPSRGSMHMGQYPHHSGIYGFEQTHQNASHVNSTVADELKANGYKTSRFGKGGFYIFKWEDKLTWNETGMYDFTMDMKNDLQRNGFTDFYKNTVYSGSKEGVKEQWYYPNNMMKSYWVERTDGNILQSDKDAMAEIEEEQALIRSYLRINPSLIMSGESSQSGSDALDGRITQAFQNYLHHANKEYLTLNERNVSGPNTTQPQFIHLGYHFPHTPVLPPRTFRDKFKDKIYKLPLFSQEELPKLPLQLQNMHTKMQTSGMTHEEKQWMIRDYYAFCAYGDSLIGEAVKSFKSFCKDQQQEYLIVIACGDHGWHLGEQGINAKFAPYRQSNHTAIVVISSDKQKFPAGKVVNDFVEYVDFAPTFYAAAGIDITNDKYHHLDGYNLAEVSNETIAPRPYVIGEMNHVIGDRAYLRTSDFAFSMKVRKQGVKPKEGNLNKQVTWPLTCTTEEAEMALYDLRIDAQEQNNVAYNTEYVQLADWYRTKLCNIVLGDGRVECDWTKANLWEISNFAEGADDKSLNIPSNIIPSEDDTRVLLQDITFNTNAIEIEIGSSIFMEVTFTPFSASNKQMDWLSDNETIATVKKGIITGEKVGETTVDVFSQEDNSISKRISVKVIDKDTSISSNRHNNLINFYPVPCSEKLFYSASKPITTIAIYDVGGNKLLTETKINMDSINIATLQSGIYFLHTVFADKSECLKKIIKS